MTDSMLGGRYLLGAELGSGGAAVVHRAWDSRLQREVAVKVLRTVLLDPAARERFEQEARILARLDHPGLVAVFDAALVEDHPYLVMELVEGRSLAGRRVVAPAEVARIGAAVAEVLAYVHASGVTHRDVKPGNILIAADGRVRLADFGIARFTADDHHPTVTGTVVGTPAYLAPEQVRGEPATEASDVYALGLVLVELLRGAPVYQGAPEIAALARLMAPPAIDPTWPAPLPETLAAMTAADPTHRPGAATVATRLTSVPVASTPFESGTAEQTTPASPATAEETVALPVPSKPPRSRKPLLAGVLAAAVLVPGLALGGHLLSGPGSGTPANGTGAAPAVVTAPATSPATTTTTSPGPTSAPAVKRRAEVRRAEVVEDNSGKGRGKAKDKPGKGKSGKGNGSGKGKG